MNPQRLVAILLDDLPGVDQETLDKIMATVYTVVDRIKSGNPAVDRPRFEQEVNPLLEPYGIRFDANDPELVKYMKPARAGIDGLVVMTPQRINRREFDMMREMISHELVHGDQMTRAMMTGNLGKMYQSSHRKILPGGVFSYQAYQTDPHEVTAHARSAVDRMRHRKMTRPQALQALKSFGSPLKHVDPKAHKRFLKHAAGYAQQLPET